MLSLLRGRLATIIERHTRIAIALVLGFLWVGGCATLPENSDRPLTYALTGNGDSLFAKSITEEKAAHPGQSGFLLLGSGLDAFVARAVLARTAERSIDAQYYLFHGDLVGALFLDLLLEAADRGVRVRLLVDDMGLAGRDLGAAIADSHPNMEVRLFNPFSRKSSRAIQLVTRFGSVTRRMHNKSFTVDNQATILGGRNIGNEYFEADPAVNFADLDVLAVGPVVAEVSASFDQYWNSELAYPATALKGGPPTPEEIEAGRRNLDQNFEQQQNSVYLSHLRDSALARAIRSNQVRYAWGKAEIVSDAPGKLTHDTRRTDYHLAPQLKPYFDNVSEELIIFSPYFVPGKKGVWFLNSLAHKGVKVRILTNSLASNDVGIVHSGYAKYRKALLRGGVELYEMNKKLSRELRQERKGPHGASKASLHAKSFVFDSRRVFVGSLNLDPRSIAENTEIGVVFDSPGIAGQMTQWFDDNIDKAAFRLELKKEKGGRERILWHGWVDGRKVVFNVDPYTGFWQRFGVGLMGLLPIESQL